jgi:hypothetical protein
VVDRAIKFLDKGLPLQALQARRRGTLGWSGADSGELAGRAVEFHDMGMPL